MDLSETIVPKSDQLNADDLMTGPVTVTVAEVSKGSAEQPVDIHLVEFPGRAFRPSKSMRRVLVEAWGKESSVYTGRRMTLFRDPEIKFGADKVGGIRISHLSHIDGRLSIPLTVTRGKRQPFTVEPLTDAAAPSTKEPTAKQVADCTDIGTLGAMWKVAGPGRREQIEGRVADLQAAADKAEV
jgi:hypothetical protein